MADGGGCSGTSQHSGWVHRVFFRVMLPSVVREKKLKLPAKFVRGYGDELSSMARLSLPNGFIWKVGLAKTAADEIWFSDGWDSFASCNSINSGYLMVFKYVGSSAFEVEIFDQSTCSIRYDSGGHCVNAPRSKRQKRVKHCDCVPANKAGVDDGDGGSEDQYDLENSKPFPGKGEDGGDSGHIATSQTPIARRKNGPKRRRTQVIEITSSPDSQVASETLETGDPEKLRSCLAAKGIHTSKKLPLLSPSLYKSCKNGIQEAMKLKLKRPSFLAVVHSVGVNRAARPFTIPASFMTDHIRGECKSITLEVFKGRGGVNKWKLGTTLRACSGAGLLMAVGWTDFASDNNLGIGDVCLFQLTSPEDRVMRVSIFRALPGVEEGEEMISLAPV
ncbi:unnamed protein product [Linum tenue]|uniref:TF-B3 domain-containing protein n=1 Tax=Linum tenue TaxID=586396 RepID=A0AAV0JD59_9ROSI|nr:unnamed protein product [Linum tenue]